MITWTDKQLASFKDELKRAREKRKSVSEDYDWNGNRERYITKPTKGEVNVGADFRDVERKKAALFNAMPPVVFTADVPMQPVMGQKDPMTGQAQPVVNQAGKPLTIGTLVPIHQELVNGLLGPRHANAEIPLTQGVFDVLCTSGVGVFKVGYENRTVQVEAPIPGSMNPVTGQPMTQPTDVPIWEKWFLSRCSPKGLLLPADFRNTDHSLSPWIGYDVAMPSSHARRIYNLGDDWKSSGAVEGDKPYFDDEQGKASPNDPEVIVTHVEYKTEYYAEPGQDVHPEQITRVVFVDETVVKHEPHPDQTIGEDGRLTPDSIDRFTIQTMIIRDLSDAAWVPSDCSVTSALTKEINKYRTVTVSQRESQRTPMFLDSGAFDSATRDKIEKGQHIIFLEEGKLAAGIEQIAAQLPPIAQGRESYIGQDYIERDREKVLGMGDNQSGTVQKGTTATEAGIAQKNSEARFEQEHQRVLKCYLSLVRLFDRYVLRYCDARNAALILGEQRAQLWATHKHALMGGYHYDLAIDAGKHLDIEAQRRQVMQKYAALRPDPNVNPIPLLEEVARVFGDDPNALIVRELPEKKPEPPKINFTIASTDLNPALPQFPIVIEVMRLGGIPISAQSIIEAKTQAQALAAAGRNSMGDSINEPMEAMIAGQAPMPTAGVAADPKAPKDTGHPGMQPPQPSLNKHLMDESGQMQGPVQ
jgi:hypothetical protein